jgi:hypothetical protein
MVQRYFPFSINCFGHYLVDGCQGQIMVKELPILHQHEGVSSVQVGHVSVDHDGHLAPTL